MDRPTLLLINKFYHDVGPAGGVGRYLLQEEEDLAAAGWRVVPAICCKRKKIWRRRAGAWCLSPWPTSTWAPVSGPIISCARGTTGSPAMAEAPSPTPSI